MEDIRINDRVAVFFYQEDSSLTFIKPFSGYYDDQLIVIQEDAYGDAVSGLMHLKTIMENFHLSSETMVEIQKRLEK